MKSNKKNLKIMAIAGITLLLMVVGATYAFFAAQAGNGTGTSINATTGTTDSLSFTVGKDIEVKADMENFLEGMENRHGETTATATLKANNNTNSATARYNVFFIIDQNDFEYSTEDGRTELLMKVTDPNGNEVMDITGLKRVEGGFDITTRTGGFLIMADYDIAATPTETTKSQTWKLEVTFVNLDEEQNDNKGKSLNGRFYITKEQESTYELAEINNIEATPSSNSITANLTSLAGTSEIAKYYYAIEEDTTGMAYIGAGVSVARLSNHLAITDSDYIESNQPTHTFTNLKPSTTYKVYSYAKDIYGIKSNVYETSITTADYELPRVIGITQSVTLNSITVTATAEKGENEIDKYYFSKDNGVTWSEGQDSNTYTFNDLLDTTEYKIKVKVIDTNNIYSTEYAKTIATTTYNNPSITTVNATKTYNSISLTTTAAGGTNSVAKYYYKVDNGNWSAAQTTNTYNITSGLTENTKYTIYVKVEDTIGRMSNEYSLDVTTNTYEIPSVTATTSVTTNSITIDATGTAGDGAIAKYMYSKDGGSNWTEQDSTSTTDSYTFENLTPGATFQIRVKVVDNNNRESTVYSSPVMTNQITLADVCTGQNMATCFKNNYTNDNNLYYHSTALADSAEDNSYRYSGENPDNYVCFGSNAATCPEDNLYRIIGIFDNQIKLIKNTSYGSYNWNNSLSDTPNWNASYLNATVLNTTYLNSLESSWQNKIVTHTWNQGVFFKERSYSNSAKETYDYELGTNKINNGVSFTYNDDNYTLSNLTTNAKIGIMYISDYYFATTPENWTSKSTKENNWLYLGVLEWTMARNFKGESISYPFTIGDMMDASRGQIATGIQARYQYAVRPTFYLNSNAILSSGSGTQSDPYRLEWEPTLADVCTEQNMSTCFASNYTKDNNLYYHSTTLANSAEDNSYRYSGENPDNYVCFGSTASTCPEDNLYRIIGIFDNQLKLIKSASYGNYNWNNSNISDLIVWKTAYLNTDVLNKTYLNTFESAWQNKIAPHTWNQGMFVYKASSYSNSAKETYDYELGANKINNGDVLTIRGLTYTMRNLTTDAKIGIMYISDYYFATSPENWTSKSTKENNWMYLGVTEWTMARSNGGEADNYVFTIGHTMSPAAGDINTGVQTRYQMAVRPTFYLNSNATLSSGLGTQSNPYRIS